MAIACAVSYLLTTELLGGFIDRGDTLLGGMWAAVATLFVFRETREGSVSAGISRLTATFVSFVLSFIYIAFLPVNAAGIGLVIGVGTIVMLFLGRREDIVTTGITTTVVLVVAAIDPKHALAQPSLRLLDTVVGIGVGMLAKWAGSYAVARAGIIPVSDNASHSTARQAEA
ncbi:FUSC family protein [Bradyrhizobium sp. UFLA05-112]